MPRLWKNLGVPTLVGHGRYSTTITSTFSTLACRTFLSIAASNPTSSSNHYSTTTHRTMSSSTSSSSSSLLPSTFVAWRVEAIQRPNGKTMFQGSDQIMSTTTAVSSKNDDDDDDDDRVWIHVTHSSLNYKDALSASGNKGVTRTFPHTPGIDAAGTLVNEDGSTSSSSSSSLSALVTGYDLGMNTDGGYGEYIHVPRSWVVTPNPMESARVAMIYGTAGLTAGLCVQKLLDRGKATPPDGPVLVTGATGSVGSVAVEILANLGFDVVAVTGKVDSYHHNHLLELGATKVVGRDVLEVTSKPMVKPLYAHAIDTVGGNPLAELLKQIQPGGSVACCGLVAGPQLDTTVLPFILRGINLLGVDSVEIPLQEKKDVWEKLATSWRCPKTEACAKDIGRHELDAHLEAFLKGQSAGKILLNHSLSNPSPTKSKL
jgi:acrylyl-CoA reductase (NADPH)